MTLMAVLTKIELNEAQLAIMNLMEIQHEMLKNKLFLQIRQRIIRIIEHNTYISLQEKIRFIRIRLLKKKYCIINFYNAKGND